MLSDVLATIAARDLLHRGDRVVVAVSGRSRFDGAAACAVGGTRAAGADAGRSAAVDHGLRADARREVALVRERAAALGLPFSVVEVDVAAGAACPPWRLRPGCRPRRRLRALAALAARTARTAWRWAIKRTIRRRRSCTGASGATAWRAWRGFRTVAEVFIRPLLDVTRAQIRRYLRLRSIPSIEDPSNADTRFARARIRHHILPALAGENPRVAEALRSLAALGARRGRRGGRFFAVAAERPRAVARLAARGGTASIDVAGGRRIEVSYGKMRIDDGPGARTVGAPAGAAAPVVIERPGGYRWPGAGVIQLRDGIARGGKENTSSSAEFDADRLAWPLVMRARRPGDKMRPRGARAAASSRTS
jgi:tRNA(Ile)-lysidine synthase